jgi:hypothetical protein
VALLAVRSQREIGERGEPDVVRATASRFEHVAAPHGTAAFEASIEKRDFQKLTFAPFKSDL